jgi:hypothetical protein
MPPTLSILCDAADLECHQHTDPRGLQDVQHKVVVEGVWAATQRFAAYGADELCNALRFKYIGHVLSHNNNDIPAMRRNPTQVGATWGWIYKILSSQEAPTLVRVCVIWLC